MSLPAAWANPDFLDKLSRVKRNLTTIVWVLLACVMNSSVVIADDNPYGRPPFAIPPRMGDITDYWRPVKGEKNLNLQNQQLVVRIEVLHATVGVQKNIAAVLYRLNHTNKDRGLLVCVEGASGEGDVSLLRSLPGPTRRGFEDLLLGRPSLTGGNPAATETAA